MPVTPRPARRARPVRRSALAALVALAAVGCGGLPVESTLAERSSADAALDAFVARHPTGWRVDLATRRPLARVHTSPSCSATAPSGYVTVRHETADAEVDLAFRCPVGAGDGAAALRASFAFAVLGRLPHGMATPGWTFHVLTPTSSIASGVTFADAGDGRVRVTIATPLFAAQALDTRPSCLPPADSSYPASCYRTRDFPVPLTLTLTAPLATATLR